MATCPYCAEEIQELAVKCKHCKEWLPKPELAQNSPDWVLCPDGRCTGHVYDGICSSCGLSVDGTHKFCDRATNSADNTHEDKYTERSVHGALISANNHIKPQGKSVNKIIKIAILLLVITPMLIVVVEMIQDKIESNIFLKSIDEHYGQLIASKDNTDSALLIINKFKKHNLLDHKDVFYIHSELQAAALKAKEEAAAEALKAEAAALRKKQDEMRLDALVYVQEYARKRLLSPRGAKFARPSLYWEQHVVHLGEGRYRVRSWVDAQNVFGGTVRTHFSGVIVNEGDKWKMESFSM